MVKTFILLGLFLLTGQAVSAQAKARVAIPKFKDKYTEMVRTLEAGQTAIDYKLFRESFVESEQFKVAAKSQKNVDSLKKLMYAQMDQSKYQEVITTTKKMLSIDYTSMVAHKILQQTYAIIGDSLNSKKYHDIEFGLLNSIINSGDGKTCKTAWPVVQTEEEYFILHSIGAELQKQTIDHTGGFCDKMEVLVDGKKKTYYFETSKVFKGYSKLGLK